MRLSRSFKLGLLQMSVAGGDPDRNLRRAEDLIRQAAEGGAECVVLPDAMDVGWITDGPWTGRKCIGCSLVIGPQGEEILQGPYGVDAETILEVQVTPVPRPARGCGWDEIRHLRPTRPEP